MVNLGLIAIPAHYILCLAPHVYAVSTVSKYGTWNNVNPRSPDYEKSLKQKLPASVFGKFERAESASKNSFESLPLFVAATFAGLLAEKLARVDVGTTTFAGIWLGLRVLYTLLYINTEQLKFSHLRSITFLSGVALCFYQIYKSAVAFA